jgi:hypothetical protein
MDVQGHGPMLEPPESDQDPPAVRHERGWQNPGFSSNLQERPTEVTTLNNPPFPHEDSRNEMGDSVKATHVTPDAHSIYRLEYHDLVVEHII